MTLSAFGSDPNPPSGTVALWDQPLSEIPAGWVLCDGNNGTENLLGKFAKQTSGSESVGSTGGQNSYSLATGQLPNHNHNGSTSSSGNHQHQFERTWHARSGWNEVPMPGGSGSGPKTNKSGSHSHNIDSIGTTGSGNSVDNQPEHVEVAFIMKV